MSNQKLKIRMAKPEDSKGIWQIDRATLRAWSEESYKKDLEKNPGAFYWIGEIDGEIVGFAGIWRVLDEGHITNIAVKPEFMRQGIAKEIMTYMLKWAEENGCKRETLEVRASNIAAIELYIKMGFRQEAIRYGYYDNIEDALIFWREEKNETT